MSTTADFDVQEAHRYFSAYCFNHAWDLISKTDRSAEEAEQMIQLSLASLWHWSRRTDCTRKNLSVGFWQASRVYALCGEADNARKYGHLSLEYGADEAPFYIAYACEALARAELIAGDATLMNAYLARARKYAEAVADEDSYKMLISDLDTIK